MKIKYLMTAGILLSSFQSNAASVATETGQEVGLTVSHYAYQEPDLYDYRTDETLDVNIKGEIVGLDYASTLVMDDAYFVKFDGRFTYGQLDYSGSGNNYNEPNYYFDIRPLIGKDFDFDGMVLAPYTGLGYRHLMNDGQGISTTGYWGYRRKSEYLYLPLGLTHRISTGESSLLETNIEVDYLLHGNQKSYLSDGNAGYSDIDNEQHKGYGLRSATMYRMNQFAIGPYFQYWHIYDSETAGAFIEPNNHTVEYGIKASMRF